MAVINFYMGFTHLKFFCLLSLLGNCSFSQNIIDKEEIFEIAGIKQYIRIKGKDDTKPILLFLHGGPGEGFKIFYNNFKSQFRNINIEIEDVVTQDDIESARTIVNAVHAETGSPVTFSGICMARISNGKIAEAWNQYDFLNMYNQIGLKLVPSEQPQPM